MCWFREISRNLKLFEINFVNGGEYVCTYVRNYAFTYCPSSASQYLWTEVRTDAHTGMYVPSHVRTDAMYLRTHRRYVIGSKWQSLMTKFFSWKKSFQNFVIDDKGDVEPKY